VTILTSYLLIIMLHIYDGYFSAQTFAYKHVPPYWTELNLLTSSVHFGYKPNRKRVCGSLNRSSQNHYGSEPSRTGTGQNHALSRIGNCQWGQISVAKLERKRTALEYYQLVLNILCTTQYVTSSITVGEAAWHGQNKCRLRVEWGPSRGSSTPLWPLCA